MKVSKENNALKETPVFVAHTSRSLVEMAISWPHLRESTATGSGQCRLGELCGHHEGPVPTGAMELAPDPTDGSDVLIATTEHQYGA